MKPRLLNPSDTDSVLNIFKETWLDTYPNHDFGITKEHIIKKYETKERYENIKNYISNFSDEKIGYGIEIDGTLVGVGITNMMGDKCHIGAIYVLPQYQKRGIGKILLEKLLEFRKNYKEIYLEVGSYNESAINFYKKFGFEIIKGSEGKHKVIDDVFIPTIMMMKENKALIKKSFCS